MGFRHTGTAAPFVILLFLATLSAGSCVRKPGVSIEQLYDAEVRESTSADALTPPWCKDLPSAAYPPDLPLNEQPDRVDVRVDLTLDEFGQPRHVKATALGNIVNAEPFETAARIAADELRCVPAMRPPDPESGREVAETIAYRTALLFHFYRDGREVKVGLGD